MTQTRSTRRTKQRLTLSFALPLVVLILVATFFVHQVSHLLDLSQWMLHTESVIAKIHEQQKLLLDLETGLRGYLVGHDEVFLGPYNAAVNIQPSHLENIARLTDDNPAQRERTTALRNLSRDWREAAVREIDTGPFVYRKADLLERKALMDRMRAQIDAMLLEENGLLSQRRADVETSSRANMRILIIALILFAAVLGYQSRNLITTVSQDYDRALRELEMANSQLETRVADRTLELSRSNAQFEASNQELEAFCYSVSHDLRSPLRGIDGFSQAVLEDYDAVLDPTGKKYLHFIREGIQRMGSLIDDLLELSRLTRADLKREAVDLSACAAAIAEDLNREAAENPVAFIAAPDLRVDGDPGLLRAALQNLLSNAWKFSSKAGHPTVELGVTEKEGRKVYFVRDNGAGFDMAYYDKLFGAFQRLHSPREFQGTGIGLATVRRILHRHGGSIWAEGKVGEGATFYFTL